MVRKFELWLELGLRWEPYPDITFNITIRRKTLFHTVNLIIP